MPTTPLLAVPYPTLSDDPNVPEDLLALANWLETSFPGALRAWTDYTPVVYNNMGTTPAAISAGSLVVNYSRWATFGKFVFWQFSVAVNVITTNGLGIALPVACRERRFNLGTLRLTGGGTLPADQSGLANMASGPPYDKLVLTADSNGFRNTTAASGQVLQGSVFYEKA